MAIPLGKSHMLDDVLRKLYANGAPKAHARVSFPDLPFLSRVKILQSMSPAKQSVEKGLCIILHRRFKLFPIYFDFNIERTLKKHMASGTACQILMALVILLALSENVVIFSEARWCLWGVH